MAYEKGLWGIVSETESPPDKVHAEKYAKFLARRDCVLFIDLSLLYFIGNPENPIDNG